MSLVCKSQTIVLHLTKYGDSGLIAHVLDNRLGRRGIYLRGIKKSKNSAVIAQFHNLAILEVVTAASTKSKLLYMQEYHPLVQLHSIRTDISKSAIALFVSEVIYRTLREESGDEELFEWLKGMISALEALEGNSANFHLKFLVGFCRQMGFLPHDNYSEQTPLFDIISARYVSAGALRDSTYLFTEQDSLLLYRLLNADLNEAMQIPLNARARSGFCDQMLKYLSYWLDTPINIRSLAVLHTIFA
ncbi:MAG TPA: DNA repair protein RecO [Bacteroidales bacterium]|nr:DNA repair protein RecO [Bacteroidales bacterium]HPK29489.1 DNA repair protein RecO [Bacteroidales bacterium]